MHNLLDEFENYLKSALKENTLIAESMRYSLNAGGKRFRPLLFLNTAADLGVDVNDVLPVALSIEMIHTYSLIHDDLPSLDNDDLRRGKPTNHIIYGDDIALLAGDGLLTQAFVELVSANIDSVKIRDAVSNLGKASGYSGMIFGQVLDVTSSASNIETVTLDDLKKIHQHKTGDLITSSLVLAAIVSDCSKNTQLSLSKLGYYLGIWFQIRDDIFDEIKSTDELGKPAKSDERNNKLTYVSFLGLSKAQEELKVVETQIRSIFTNDLNSLTNLKDYIYSIM